MKKLLLLIIMTILVVPATAQKSFADNSFGQQTTMMQDNRPTKKQMRIQFEERLGLTDKQKEKARKLHEKGRNEMQPVMEEMRAKYQEVQTVKNSKMAPSKKSEKLEQLQNEIKPLQKQANDIRKKNSEEFEKILNKTQKAELEKMKAEGRAKFEKEHKSRPPFQGLGTPGFFFRPLLPPQSAK